MIKKFTIAFIVFGLYFFGFSTAKALAAVKCWHGSSGANFNVDANWVTTTGGATTVPGSSDVATFDSGTGQCSSGVQNTNVTIPAGYAVNVKGINITANYTQTITQTTTSTITVGSSSWTQAGGTFTGGSGNITIQSGGGFNLSAGTFTSTSGTLLATKGWSVSGSPTFNANNGTVNLSAADSGGVQITVTGSITFYNLTFLDTGCTNRYFSIGSGTILTVTNTLYFNESGNCNGAYVNGPGQIYAQGNISAAGDYNNGLQGFVGNAEVVINGTGNQTLSGNDTSNYNSVPAITINKTSGNLTITNNVAVGGNWTFTQMGGGGVINGSGTITFAPSVVNNSFTISGSSTLPNVGFFHGDGTAMTITIASGTTLTSSGNLNLQVGFDTNDFAINGPGQLVFQGNLSVDSSSMTWDGTAAISLTGSNSQTITDNNTTSISNATITFNKSGGTITLATNWAINATNQDLLVAAGSSQTLTGAFTLTVNDVTSISGTLIQGTTSISSGSYTISSSGIWTNNSTGGIVVGSGGLSNSGTIYWTGSTGCGGAVTISVTSSSNGVPRTWTGGGSYYLTNISLKDQSTSLGLTAYDSTNVSGNSGFTFIASCPSTANASAYWSFDEGYGTVAHDASTNQINGTLSGTTLPAWKPESYCVSGKCLYFDGSSSHVDFTGTLSAVKTVSLWVKPNSVASTSLIDLDGGTHKITVSSGVISASGFSSPTIYVNGYASSIITANTWNFVEVTTSTSFSASGIVIGKSSSGVLQGFIDEVAIYNSTKTAAQVQSDYASRGGFHGASAILGSNNLNQTALTNGLVGYWDMQTLGGTTNFGTTTQLGTVDNNANILVAHQYTLSQAGTLVSLSSANLDLGNITRDQIEQLLTDAQNQLNSMNQMASGWNSNTATSSASVDSLAIQNLFVTDKAAINQVTVSNSVSIGSDMVLQSSLSQNGNAVNSIDTLSQPLLIQSLALAPIQFMAGKVQIDTTGNMTINGNLAVTGTIQSGGLTLQPDTQTPNSATTSGFGKLLSVLNSQGGEVAGISASGEASFASVTTGKLAVKADENATQSASLTSNFVTSDASAGKATIPGGSTEITIINSTVKSTDLIYITPTTQTGNNVLFVKTQDGCEKSKTNSCKPSFTIAIPNAYSSDIEFNWWIVGQQ